MSLVIPPETEYAKEMRKWEAYPSKFGQAGRPYQFQDFPKRLYLAKRNAALKIEIVDAQTAHDEHEERNLLSRGFHFGQDKAIAAIEQEQAEHGALAAERNYEIKHGRISERAAAEVRQAEAEHVGGHMPVMPEAPVKRRGRPKNVAALA